MDVESLRFLIRVRMQDGRLPRESAPQAFGRPGNEQKCNACDEILTTAKLMMEVTSDGKIFLFHGDCYLLWSGWTSGQHRCRSCQRVHSDLLSTSHAARCVACHGVRSHPVPERRPAS